MHPIVGQPVQFTAADLKVYAAIIVAVDGDLASVAVLPLASPTFVFEIGAKSSPVAGLEGCTWSPLPNATPPPEPKARK